MGDGLKRVARLCGGLVAIDAGGGVARYDEKGKIMKAGDVVWGAKPWNDEIRVEKVSVKSVAKNSVTVFERIAAADYRVRLDIDEAGRVFADTPANAVAKCIARLKEEKAAMESRVNGIRDRIRNAESKLEELVREEEDNA